jgi:hypothetical protein
MEVEWGGGHLAARVVGGLLAAGEPLGGGWQEGPWQGTLGAPGGLVAQTRCQAD